MEKPAEWSWMRATIIAVTVALCAACVQVPYQPPHPIQDKIDRDASVDRTWIGS